MKEADLPQGSRSGTGLTLKIKKSKK